MAPKPAHTNDTANPYIPKYIATNPWYRQLQTDKVDSETVKVDDALAHQRKDPGQLIDHSLAQPGQGIQDKEDNTREQGYDSKRDRWHGFDAAEWDRLLQEWTSYGNQVKKQKRRPLAAANNFTVKDEDLDDTDYELEMTELGLDKKPFSFASARFDPGEQSLRDRHDVPTYIGKIGTAPDNKKRIDEITPQMGIVNDAEQFVRARNDNVKELRQLQRISWELNERDVKANAGSSDMAAGPQAILDYSLEASPTLASLLATKRSLQEKTPDQSQKRRALLDRYR